jgi:DNA-binding NarL/FixJ family response regulator
MPIPSSDLSGDPSSDSTEEVRSVLIVDDHPAVREGLAIRVSRQPDMQVCGEVGDVTAAMQMIDENPPDIAVIDLALKAGSGLDLVRRIKARHPEVMLLVWSMYEENLYAERALQAGAHGYVNKEQATDTMIDAIRQVLAGKIYLSDPISNHVLIRAFGGTPPSSESGVEQLSDRELEVFRFLGRGFDTHQIASHMGVSPKTVETYRARIKQKLNLRKNNELIRSAVEWLVKTG